MESSIAAWTMENGARSLNREAERIIPGGVSSSSRKYPEDLFIVKSAGPCFWDQDGRQYLDYDCAGGSVIVGYGSPAVQQKIVDAIHTQLYYGVGATEPEVALAEKLVAHVRGVEKVQLCNGNTDAIYHAIRLARAVTRREKLIVLQGADHGWNDYVVGSRTAAARSFEAATGEGFTGETAAGVDSMGVLHDAADRTVVCRINDFSQIEATCRQNPGAIAAIICDPFNSALGCIRLEPGYVRRLRALCDAEGIILIFDETRSAFRVALDGSGISGDGGIVPDLVALGGALSGGYPVAAVGGKASLMDRFNTGGGDVSTQNTYYGNPVMAAAGIAVIEELEKPGVFERLSDLSDQLASGLLNAASAQGIPFCEQHQGGLIGFWFGEGPVSCLDDVVSHTDAACLEQFRQGMLARGCFLPKGPCGTMRLTLAHSAADIEETVRHAAESLKNCKGGSRT